MAQLFEVVGVEFPLLERVLGQPPLGDAAVRPLGDCVVMP